MFVIKIFTKLIYKNKLLNQYFQEKIIVAITCLFMSKNKKKLSSYT